MSDLTNRLRALSRSEHDDLSVAGEAADRIEELQSTLNVYANMAHEDFNAGMQAAAGRSAEIAQQHSYAGAIPQAIREAFGMEE